MSQTVSDNYDQIQVVWLYHIGCLRRNSVLAFECQKTPQYGLTI